MRDGTLNKCKSCAKKDVALRVEKKKLDPSWMAGERARCRVKQVKYRELGLAAKPSPEARERWVKKFPHKLKAESIANNAVRCGKLVPVESCEDCGKKTKLQKHHEDYSKPLDVNWLCTKCHGIRHRKD